MSGKADQVDQVDLDMAETSTQPVTTFTAQPADAYMQAGNSAKKRNRLASKGN